MFVMRYKKEHCGNRSLEDFLRIASAEGLPIYRGYELTLSQQPALAKLIAKRPEYIRVQDTPVADAATKELIYIQQEIFLGSESDMDDIAGALRKIDAHCAK